MLIAAASDRHASMTRLRPGMQAVMMDRLSAIWDQIVGMTASRVTSRVPEKDDDTATE